MNGIVSSAMDAIISTDEHQKIVLFNESAERMFHHRASDLIGRSIDILIPESHREKHRQLVRAFGESGVTTRMMRSLGLVRARRSSGAEFPAEAAISQVRTGGIQYYTVILRDITNRVRAQEALAQSHAELDQRVQARTAELEKSRQRLQAFNYAFSHDLRAPVRHINGFAEIALQDDASLSESARTCLNRIIAAAHRMDGIIQGLLHLAQTSASQPHQSPVNLCSLITEVATECTPPNWKGEIHIDTASLPVVTGDEALLRQVFVNLIANAFKFTSRTAGPRIEISGAGGNADETFITVRDNGAGFDMQYASKLFTPLQRLHHYEEFEGTGIGLASAKNILDLHGGRIWTESAPNRGASFFVALKRHPAPPAGPA